jgi:hypothetical protein
MVYFQQPFTIFWGIKTLIPLVITQLFCFLLKTYSEEGLNYIQQYLILFVSY